MFANDHYFIDDDGQDSKVTLVSSKLALFHGLLAQYKPNLSMLFHKINRCAHDHKAHRKHEFLRFPGDRRDQWKSSWGASPVSWRRTDGNLLQAVLDFGHPELFVHLLVAFAVFHLKSTWALEVRQSYAGLMAEFRVHSEAAISARSLLSTKRQCLRFADFKLQADPKPRILKYWIETLQPFIWKHDFIASLKPTTAY